ncbi:MAG: glycine cleavage system protein GcvH [Chromatiales bacterium]|nr:glycine cleavage system protein GcvH [Gammaproteobacteria bacterium]MBW6476085.1 glycine cleavage system protein GcvH [Chromatiales bacterium]
MSNIPSDLKYSKSHEWVRREADGSITVGISDHAQELLGDMVFVELPEVGRQLAAGEECAVVESVKAASDVYAPLAGEVLEVNRALEDSPEIVNQAPYGDGWLYRMQPADVSALDALMDSETYATLVAAEA